MGRIIFFVLLLFCVKSYSQEFHKNSVGIVYFESQNTDFVDLKVVIPMWRLEGYEITRPITEFKTTIHKFQTNKEIELFNQNGFITKVLIDTVSIDFWCENDGGIQYRPTIYIKVKKTDLKNALDYIDNYSILCFAIVNRTEDFKNIDKSKIENEIKRKGDFNNDGIPDAIIWSEYDEAENCDDGKDSTIFLQDYNMKFVMNCCGP